MRQALEEAGLYDEVLGLPNGFDTKLNGNGVPLSRSQRDLLCLARAVAGKPRLLLIDGILDGLPDESLERTLSSLLNKKRGWTLVIATGKKAIAEQCEQILELRSKLPATNARNEDGNEVSQ